MGNLGLKGAWKKHKGARLRFRMKEYMWDIRYALCHYPIPCFKNHFYGAIHLYGHVHNSFESKMMEHDRFLMENLYGQMCRMYNVGAMMPWMDYTPRTLDEIIANYPPSREGDNCGKELDT